MINILWLSPNGDALTEQSWSGKAQFCAVLTERRNDGNQSGLAITINGSHEACSFKLPADCDWRLLFSSAVETGLDGCSVALPAQSIALSGSDLIS